MWNKFDKYFNHDLFYNDNYTEREWIVLNRNEVIEYGFAEK